MHSVTQEQIKSPIWRICNIYTIKDDQGRPIPFRPNKQQKRVLRAIYIKKQKKIFIPKARQLGMSTLVAIIILDSILFGAGVQCSICDFVSGNAKKKLEGKIVYGFEKLPAEWRNGWEIVTHNKQSGEFRIRKVNGEVADESVVYAGDKPRGDTYQVLHLSELGETQVKAPERAKEIFEGSLPTAEMSLIIIETTWHGGRVGVLYKLVHAAINTPDEDKDPDKDYFVYFFPWFEDKKYTSKGDAKLITGETRDYFATLKSSIEHLYPGLEFSVGQMLWYQKKKVALGHRIYSMYPSRLEEIFLSPVDGAIYAREIDEARVGGRFGKFPYDPTLPVDTLWDFGSPENTICLYFQQRNGKFYFIDADVVEEKTDSDVIIKGLDMPFPNRIKYMMTKPYSYGSHYVPHDGVSRDIRHRTSWQTDMMEAGLTGKIVGIPRAESGGIWLGINKVKAEFQSFYFDQSMSVYLDGLAMYRLRPDPGNEKKFTNDPIHDFASHLADPLRVLGEGILHGYVSPSSLMNTNLVLDQINLEKVTASASTKIPSVGIIETQGFKECFKTEVGGWMQKWESATFGDRYLVVIHGNAAQAWRGVRHGGQDLDRMRLVASVNTEDRYDPDLLVERACLMSKYYGGCIIIPTINNRDGIIREILDRRCRVYSRRIKDSMRPQNRSKPALKPGLDLDPSTRESFISNLVRDFRDDKAIIHDLAWLHQASTFILNDDGTKVAMPGYKDDHIVASAIAISKQDIAQEFLAPGSENDLIRYD